MNILKYIKRALLYVVHGQPIKQTNVTVKVMEATNVLKGRNIVITGGTRGLGYYVAKKCVRDGANVLITGRNQETIKQVAEELGNHCSYLVCDVRNLDNMSSFFYEAEKKLGVDKIDSFVSNAGISLHEGDFRNVTLENWNAQFETNLRGNYFLVKEFICYLEEHTDKSGNIVVVSSERAERPDDIPYGMTKVATNSFVKAFAAKVIGEGIRINAVAPGVTATDMTGFKHDSNLHNGWQRNERIFLPEEVAEVVGFLLSDTSACISGEVIACDQGNYISIW